MRKAGDASITGFALNAPLLTSLPVVGSLVEIVSTRSEIAVILRHIFQTSGRRLLENIFRHRDDVAALVGIVIEHRPGNRMIFFSHAENAAESEHGEHD